MRTILSNLIPAISSVAVILVYLSTYSIHPSCKYVYLFTYLYRYLFHPYSEIRWALIAKELKRKDNYKESRKGNWHQKQSLRLCCPGRRATLSVGRWFLPWEKGVIVSTGQVPSCHPHPNDKQFLISKTLLVAGMANLSIVLTKNSPYSWNSCLSSLSFRNRLISKIGRSNLS